ncbi:MAG: 30S ribosomal protein S4 [Candidatus Omnitrophica bacterium]|nr:30S ribosomal protein S4 [Candidatus Omnitrophota bacterium]
MARYIDAVCRLCRRQGEKLFLKGTKCNADKCPINKRPYAPGQHGEGKGKRQKLSNYGLQLREKQKVKRTYGVLERQFRKYFDIASRSKGVTGKVLLQLLERRLDNVVFRMGLGVSRSQARQIVRHNFILVNSKRVNIPSFSVSKDDLIQVKAKEKALAKIKDNLELSKERSVPSWLEFKAADFSAKVLRLPEKEDIQQNIQEQLIVELYSK